MKRISHPYVKQALLDTALWEVATFEALPSCPPITSPQLTKKIERLARAQRRFTWRFVKTAKRRFITVLITILLLFTLSLSISSVRESLFYFITKTFSFGTDFEVSKNDNSTKNSISTYKKPLWLPEDYEEQHHYKSAIASSYTWSNKSTTIHFNQHTLNNKTFLDTEQATFQKIYVNQLPVYVNEKNGLLTFLWMDNDYSYQLYCPSEIGLENAVKIIESVS